VRANNQSERKIRFHHVGIVVKSIHVAIEKFAGALGVDRNAIAIEEMSYMTGKGEVETFKYAFLPLADGENNFIELVEPITPGPTARYLEKHGEGLFHLAFESSDIQKTIENFEKNEISLAGATPTKEVLSVFFHPKSAHGVLIQVIRQGIFDNAGRVSQEVINEEST
jgi:catechol 2,3-dioxygenase-like lactoylglutathione lyase family enzyme